MSSYQQVDIYVTDTVTMLPMEGMLVRIYSEDGKTFYTEGITDPDGKVGFMLYTRAYSMRFFKFQVSVQQPQVFIVLEGDNGAPVLNEFQVSATSLDRPTAKDPRLCRASGFFRDITGAPHRNLDIIFIGDFAPILLDNAGVLSERRMIRTDKCGYACIDLIRCAKYSVTIEGLEDKLRHVRVPDAPSANLPDLLFETVQSVSYAEALPYQSSVGGTLSLTPTTLTSTGIPITDPTDQNILWSLSDPTVATLRITAEALEISGVRVGTVELRAERRDKTIIKIPYNEFLEGSVQTISVV